MIPDEPTDGWKQFIRSREQFTCTGMIVKLDIEFLLNFERLDPLSLIAF